MPQGIGELRGCRRGCKQCVPLSKQSRKHNRRSCVSFPVIKEYHQGVVMTGKGKPPKSVGGVDHPRPKCFVYWYWYDFENDLFYRLRRATNGELLGYDVMENGSQILLNFLLTSPGNIGALGSFISTSQLFALQNCANTAANSAANAVNRTNIAGQRANSVDVAASTLNCAINTANKGTIGFIYGNPPVPGVIDSLVPGQGYSLNPDIWLVPGALDDEPVNGFQDFGWIVFRRDQRRPAGAGAYYRDSFNSSCNDPQFPSKPCDGDLHADERFNLLYEFNADFCRWYLIDTVTPIAWGPDALNQGLEAAGFCELEADRNKHCNCAASDSESEHSADD